MEFFKSIFKDTRSADISFSQAIRREYEVLKVENEKLVLNRGHKTETGSEAPALQVREQDLSKITDLLNRKSPVIVVTLLDTATGEEAVSTFREAKFPVVREEKKQEAAVNRLRMKPSRATSKSLTQAWRKPDTSKI